MLQRRVSLDAAIQDVPRIASNEELECATNQALSDEELQEAIRVLNVSTDTFERRIAIIEAQDVYRERTGSIRSALHARKAAHQQSLVQKHAGQTQHVTFAVSQTSAQPRGSHGADPMLERANSRPAECRLVNRARRSATYS
jgi:hypothetical protein